MKSFHLAIFSFLASAPVYAQLDNTVEVTNEVKPIVTEAQKVEVKTQAIKTEVKHYTMPYAVQGKNYNDFPDTPLGHYSTDEVDKGNKKGHLRLGGGSHGNLDGQAIYQFDITPQDALTFDLSLSGFNGKTGKDERFGDKDWTSRFYANRSSIRYAHRLADGADVYAKGTFENQLFNYRGATTVTDKQHNVMFDAAVGLTPYTSGAFTVEGEAGVKVFNQNYLTTYQKKLGETQFIAEGKASYAFSQQHGADIDVSATRFNYRNDELKDHTCLSFAPHYTYTDEAVRLRLGIFANIEGDIAPDIQFAYTVNGAGEVYAEARGYERENEMCHLASVNPYFMLPAVGDEPLEANDEFHQLDARLGYRFKTKSGINADIYGGYDMSENHVDIISVTPLHDGRIMPLIDFKKNKNIYFGADITYSYRDFLKLTGRNRLNIESTRQEWGWTEGSYITPAFTMDWQLDLRLLKDLYLGIGWTLDCYSNPELEGSHPYALERKNTVLLDAGIRYTLPLELPATVFVRGSNLFCQKYDRYYGYQAPSANVMAGFSLSF